MLKNIKEGSIFLNPVFCLLPDYRSPRLWMRRLVLETCCGFYVGQRTAETRAEAPVMRSTAERRCGICRRELWKSDYHGNDVWEWEQRQTGRKSCYHKFCCEGGTKCVLAAVWGGQARTQARERCYSRAGEVRNWAEKKRKGWIRKLEVRKNPC